MLAISRYKSPTRNSHLVPRNVELMRKRRILARYPLRIFYSDNLLLNKCGHCLLAGCRRACAELRSPSRSQFVSPSTSFLPTPAGSHLFFVALDLTERSPPCKFNSGVYSSQFDLIPGPLSPTLSDQPFPAVAYSTSYPRSTTSRANCSGLPASLGAHVSITTILEQHC